MEFQECAWEAPCLRNLKDCVTYRFFSTQNLKIAKSHPTSCKYFPTQPNSKKGTTNSNLDDCDSHQCQQNHSLPVKISVIITTEAFPTLLVLKGTRNRPQPITFIALLAKIWNWSKITKQCNFPSPNPSFGSRLSKFLGINRATCPRKGGSDRLTHATRFTFGALQSVCFS